MEWANFHLLHSGWKVDTPWSAGPLSATTAFTSSHFNHKMLYLKLNCGFSRLHQLKFSDKHHIEKIEKKNTFRLWVIMNRMFYFKCIFFFCDITLIIRTLLLLLSLTRFVLLCNCRLVLASTPRVFVHNNQSDSLLIFPFCCLVGLSSNVL